MNKPCSLALAMCLTLTACNGSKQKSTWQKVRETKPDKVAATADPSAAYTKKLNKVLNEHKVEHKVVTYQYRYKTRLREDAVGTHSAVIYKDNSDPENPWWLVNERTGKPVWLPGQDLNQQVSFYLRRKAEVTEEKVFSGGEPQSTETMVAKATPDILVRNSSPRLSAWVRPPGIPARRKAGVFPIVTPALLPPSWSACILRRPCRPSSSATGIPTWIPSARPSPTPS